MSEVKEYVSVNETDFGGKNTLELTVTGRILNSHLQKIVDAKVRELNAKIDVKYDAGLTDFKGTENLSSDEIKKLSFQLKDVIKGFNEEIAKIEQEYIGKTAENNGQIRTEILQYFSDKSLFVENGVGLAALRGYANMDREVAQSSRTKELPLR